MTSITRSRNEGKLQLNGASALLRGGAYDLFFSPGRPDKAVVRAGTNEPIIERYTGSVPCQSSQSKATLTSMATWAEGADTFDEFFAAMRDNRCNFVRVFLFGGTLFRNGVPVSISPFNRQVVGGRPRYDVRGAALGGRWNDAYFNRLSAFVSAADSKGVVVQLSLFNYDELSDEDPRAPDVKKWTWSPWNAANCPDATWAGTHLLPAGFGVTDRQIRFTRPDPAPAPGNGIRAVQQEFIGRVMKAVAPFRNVVLEVMNEPRPVTGPHDLERIAEFGSYMTRLIVLYRRNMGSHVLISINAVVHPAGASGKSDIDTWREKGYTHLAEVDAVSYHGLTGLGTVAVTGTGCAHAQNVNAPRVDQQAVTLRAQKRDTSHPDKALIYCSDAAQVKEFTHAYDTPDADTAPNFFVTTQDGQIVVEPEGVEPPQHLTRTYMYHWARKCLAQGAGANLGKFHFQNHSTYLAPLQHILRAANETGV